MPLFDPRAVSQLPLFAQVLLLARLLRRVGLAKSPGPDRDDFLALVDRIEAIAQTGDHSTSERDSLQAAQERARGKSPLGEAVYYALDATLAAVASLDFGAAESACRSSTAKAVQACQSIRREWAVQVAVTVAGDADLLAFACKEAGVGTYDKVTDAVLGRLTPVHALAITPQAAQEDDSR